MRSIRLGNLAIDGEVVGQGWKMALELKTPRDDVTRGIGQLAEALAYGYNQVVMVTTLRAARGIDSKVFDRLGLVLLGVDSKGQVEQVYPTYASNLDCKSGEDAMKKQIVLAVLPIILSIYAMAQITPAYGQVVSLNVSPRLPVANQPITFSGIADGGAHVFVYASSACPGMGNSAIQPIISLSSVSDQRHGVYSVYLSGGLPAGSYSVLAFNDYNVEQGTAPCRSFTVLASKPVPEFSLTGIAFIALAASLYILRRRQVKIQ